MGNLGDCLSKSFLLVQFSLAGWICCWFPSAKESGLAEIRRWDILPSEIRMTLIKALKLGDPDLGTPNVLRASLLGYIENYNDNFLGRCVYLFSIVFNYFRVVHHQESKG